MILSTISPLRSQITQSVNENIYMHIVKKKKKKIDPLKFLIKI